MAFLSVPFTSLYLVPHASGGAIAHLGGSYVANTFISPGVVEAFSIASGLLSQVGGQASAAVAGGSALLSNPVVVGSVVIAAAAVGTYCYFHGIPAPVEAALTNAGLGSATKQGFVITLPKLAVALVLLGGAGFLAYRFYKSIRKARKAASVQPVQIIDAAQAETRVDEEVGGSAWIDFGAAMWASGRDAARKAAGEAARLAATLQENGAAGLDTVWSGASAAGAGAGTLAARIRRWLTRRPRRA